ncbi:hypothetical protein [Alteromonas flava]|uniref:hypothetical protein n=1 Tax=Alteromonas flava TaxID=2048003 RepID=UPI000C293F0E|nr:hypothetical protein [Alteromonas flava]
MRKIVCLITLLFLTACVSTSEPHLVQDPVKVSPDTIDDYWVSQNDVQFNIRPSSKQLRVMEEQKVVVDARYLVDSNGNVHDIEILDSNVEVSFLNMVERALERRDFKPAESNPNRVPIIAVSRFTYESDT